MRRCVAETLAVDDFRIVWLRFYQPMPMEAPVCPASRMTVNRFTLVVDSFAFDVFEHNIADGRAFDNAHHHIVPKSVPQVSQANPFARSESSLIRQPAKTADKGTNRKNIAFRNVGLINMFLAAALTTTPLMHEVTSVIFSRNSRRSAMNKEAMVRYCMLVPTGW